MSELFTVTDPTDIEYSDDGKSIYILFNTNYHGNQYVEIPIEVIEKALGIRLGKET